MKVEASIYEADRGWPSALDCMGSEHTLVPVFGAFKGQCHQMNTIILISEASE